MRYNTIMKENNSENVPMNMLTKTKKDDVVQDFKKGFSVGMSINNVVKALQKPVKSDITIKNLNQYYPIQNLDGQESWMTPLEAVMRFAKKNAKKTQVAVTNLVNAGAELTEYAEQAAKVYGLKIMRAKKVMQAKMDDAAVENHSQYGRSMGM